MSEDKDHDFVSLEILNQSIFSYPTVNLENDDIGVETEENNGNEYYYQTNQPSHSSGSSSSSSSFHNITNHENSMNHGNGLVHLVSDTNNSLTTMSGVKRIRPDTHEDARNKKKERIEQQRAVLLDEQRIFDIDVSMKKSCAFGMWIPVKGCVRMTQLKGNFWKTCGYHDSDGFDYLTVEEALMLMEKSQLTVTRQREEDVDSNNNIHNNHKPPPPPPHQQQQQQQQQQQRISLKEFYDIVLNQIELPCYLTYTKLKSLEYAVFRHNRQTPICISDISKVYGKQFLYNDPLCYVFLPYFIKFDSNMNIEIIKNQTLHSSSSSKTLLESLISYDMYLRPKEWSKKITNTTKPISYVIITTCSSMFPPDIMLRLVDESKGIPILFALVALSSYNIIFEEFCDANIFYQWKNVVAIENPLDFHKPATVNQQLTAYNEKFNKKYGFRCGPNANKSLASISKSNQNGSFHDLASNQNIDNSVLEATDYHRNSNSNHSHDRDDHDHSDDNIDGVERTNDSMNIQIVKEKINDFDQIEFIQEEEQSQQHQYRKFQSEENRCYSNQKNSRLVEEHNEQDKDDNDDEGIITEEVIDILSLVIHEDDNLN